MLYSIYDKKSLLYKYENCYFLVLKTQLVFLDKLMANQKFLKELLEEYGTLISNNAVKEIGKKL